MVLQSQGPPVGLGQVVENGSRLLRSSGILEPVDGLLQVAPRQVDAPQNVEGLGAQSGGSGGGNLIQERLGSLEIPAALELRGEPETRQELSIPRRSELEPFLVTG